MQNKIDITDKGHSQEQPKDVSNNLEEEICWCIHRFQIDLSTKKMNQRQAETFTRALKTLKSKKAPLVKKRQTMRAVLGDYRKKMDDEEKQHKLNPKNIKFIKSKCEEKEAFIRKSVAAKNLNYISRTEISSKSSFCFNFPLPSE